MSVKVFVGGLSWGTDSDKLRAKFEEFGTVERADVVYDKEQQNRSRGFGFVTFADEESADKAIQAMNGQEFDGRRIVVNLSNERGGSGAPRSSGFGSRSGPASGGRSYGSRGGNGDSNTASSWVMAGRRRKKRTHQVKAPDVDILAAPKSFVIKTGEVSKAAGELIKDIRAVMEPNTASRLRERKNNKLKDFVAVAGQLGVSHFQILTQSETKLNIRLAKFPNGPTIYFNVCEYMLANDVSMQLRGKPKLVGGPEFSVAPLLVLNNFAVDSSAGKLCCAMLQGMFPTINTTKIKLSEVKRVVLYHYDKETDLIHFRHYLVQVKPTGISRVVKSLVVNSQIPDLGAAHDISDILNDVYANASESEAEDNTIVVGKKDVENKRAVKLVELGPRMSLKLVKILDGLCAGKTLYEAK